MELSTAETSMRKPIAVPHCKNMKEHPDALRYRQILSQKLELNQILNASEIPAALSTHLSYGLAYTVGSALGNIPPTIEECLAAFECKSSVGLMVGARAWSKHARRSTPQPDPPSEPDLPRKLPERTPKGSKQVKPQGWWGNPFGPVLVINEKALTLFWRIMNNTTWRNLHWLPHRVLVYEARVPEGYGMRWAKNCIACGEGDEFTAIREDEEWVFRGFVEPMMDGGHEIGWRHYDSV